jgi:hypothetical protein
MSSLGQRLFLRLKQFDLTETGLDPVEPLGEV